jgi:hypothetical protein
MAIEKQPFTDDFPSNLQLLGISQRATMSHLCLPEGNIPVDIPCHYPHYKSPLLLLKYPHTHIYIYHPFHLVVWFFFGGFPACISG